MNIHILSNSPTRVNSGFGIACRGLALGLKELGHKVSVSDMQNIYNKQYWNGITIYPMNSVQNATTGNLFYISEYNQLVSNLKDSSAQALIIIYPAYDNVIASNKLHELFGNTIWYYPVDGVNLPEVYLRELSKVKKVIPYTKQGREELLKSELSKGEIGTCKNGSKKEGKVNLGNVGKEIYLGFDKNTFYKFNGSKEKEYHYCKWITERHQLMQDSKVLCKRGCFKCDGFDVGCEGFEEEDIVGNLMGEEFKGKIGNLELLKDQFGVDCIFGFTGENNGERKKIDRLLAAYSMLLKELGSKSGEAMLLMHTMPVSNNGLNLWDYVKKYNLSGSKLLFVYGEEGLGNSWSDRALNCMYNSIDVNVSCSGAEGFGLPTLESMAIGIPQIAPKFSSFIELIGENGDEYIGERGLLAKIQGFDELKNGMKFALVNSKNVSELMNTMIDDKSLGTLLGNNACKWAKEYTWSHVSREFEKVIVAS